MINIIKGIFEKENYILKSNIKGEKLFFGKKGEYFLISEYNNISNDDIRIENFFESKNTNDLIKFFNKKKKDLNEIEKNTSLIILLKVENLKKDFEELKNQIMRIEEDEYFFRKYIIIYDYKGKNEVEKIKNIQNEVKKINLKRFREEAFEYEEYSKDFLLLELFIKLPFLQIIWDKKENKKLEKEIGQLMEDIKKDVKDKELDKLDNFIFKKGYSNKLEIKEGEEEINISFENLVNVIDNLENEDVEKYLDKLITLTKGK